MPETAARLLVVDDNEMNRDMLSRRLERRGFEVTCAEDGEKALVLIAERPFELVLLDIMMPGLDGWEVLKRIRAQHSATALPVIMATAKDQREDIVKALAEGANDYVAKPLDFRSSWPGSRRSSHSSGRSIRLWRHQGDLQRRNVSGGSQPADERASGPAARQRPCPSAAPNVSGIGSGCFSLRRAGRRHPEIVPHRRSQSGSARREAVTACRRRRSRSRWPATDAPPGRS